MQCSQCGAELPEHARFCLQCGTAVTPPTPAASPLPELDFVQPALTGGLFLGILSSIPFISVGNCLCCMWVLGGGGIASRLLMKQRLSGVITYGDAAFGGVLSGLFGAIVGTVISISFRVIFAEAFESQRQAVERMLQEYPIEGPMRDFAERMMSPEISVLTVAFTFILNLLIFALFAMIGGILMVALVNNKKLKI